jgi:uncharacterized protein (TIGR02145 family)
MDVCEIGISCNPLRLVISQPNVNNHPNDIKEPIMKHQSTVWVRAAGLLLSAILSLSIYCSKGNPVNDNIDNHVYGTVTDVDGNVYKTIMIGNQEWLAENLKTTKYNDGTSIPLVTNATAWGNLSTPGYCWYNNDAATYKNTYGALYNWYSVNTGKLAPTGWHVPTDSEWTVLTTFLGGDSVAGGKLKEAGTTHWKAPNTGATIVTGFSALPGGARSSNGAFSGIGFYGYWWPAASGSDVASAWSRLINNGSAEVSRPNSGRSYGFSVRCVKN